MKVWRKQTVRYTKNGKRCTKSTPGAKAKTEYSKRFYGTLRTADGKRKQVPLCEDRQASETLLRRLQTDEDRQRAVGVDRHASERKRPIHEHVNDYETHLRAKANTERYVTLTMNRLRRLLDATKTKTLSDLEASRITKTLSDWRERKRKPISVETSNHYSRAIKGFSRWLWTERRTPDDPLSPLRLLNADVDRKRKRRAFTSQELQRLIKATTESGKRLRGLTADDRAMLYVVAAYTGLRASELASLSKTSFDLGAKTVSVEAAYSKRRRNDTLPLHGSLVERLRPWLKAKADGLLWRGTWADHRCANAIKMFRSDLRRADIDYEDESGRYVDFHALRHTFITSLARNGVHPAKAKELARHSTIRLTMDAYSHVETEELRDALDSVPGLD